MDVIQETDSEASRPNELSPTARRSFRMLSSEGYQNDLDLDEILEWEITPENSFDTSVMSIFEEKEFP
jgi:hypothetical protein